MNQWLVARETGGVGLQVENASHIGHVAVGFIEAQTARHGEQIDYPNAFATAAVHGGPTGGLIEAEPSLFDESADQAGKHALGHGPAEQWCLGGKAFGIAFGND